MIAITRTGKRQRVCEAPFKELKELVIVALFDGIVQERLNGH
jgi:hypothetical protein